MMSSRFSRRPKKFSALSISRTNNELAKRRLCLSRLTAPKSFPTFNRLLGKRICWTWRVGRP